MIISFSELHRDPRVLRQIKALGDCYHIIAAGYTDPSTSNYLINNEIKWLPLEKEKMTPLIRVRKVIQLKLGLFKSYYNELAPVKSLFQYKEIEFDLVIANDIESLACSLEIAKGKPVYFDAHEYAPKERSNWLWVFLLYEFRQWQCKTYLNKADIISTVGEQIANEYSKIYKIPTPIVIPNATEYKDLRESNTSDVINLVHHGGVQKGRGLEDLIQLMGMIDERFVLNFYLVANNNSSKKQLKKLKQASRQFGHRVLFHDAVKMDKIPIEINRYDIGIYLLKPINFNNEMALPNKFFEFIQGRLGIACGPSIEMSNYIKRYELGIVSKNFMPESMAEELNKLDKKTIIEFKKNSNKAAVELSFDNYSKILLGIVESLLPNSENLVDLKK